MVIDNSQLALENFGVGMYMSLMGYFNISAPILTISSTLGSESSLLGSIPFHTMYLEDPWTLPSLSTSDEDPRPTKMEISLSVVEVSYQAILDLVIELGPSSSQIEEEDLFSLSAWEVVSSRSHDCLNDVFP